jgi:hypothetical protein
LADDESEWTLNSEKRCNVSYPKECPKSDTPHKCGHTSDIILRVKINKLPTILTFCATLMSLTV